ncbi:MAG: hypothetical protein RDA78_03480 [Roseibium sp.]|uniref:hypothetical protein n=1 Tax=Roseibium sp. TaxID=1936156 RepID=UPI003D9C26B0
MPETRAFEITDSIWKPGADWAHFLGDPGALDQPNRYAGEDYRVESYDAAIHDLQ